MSKRATMVLVGLVAFLLGCLVVQQLPHVRAQDSKFKGATLMHGLSLQYRKGNEAEFKENQKYGVEVYKDDNNGNLIYISETGSIAVVPAK